MSQDQQTLHTFVGALVDEMVRSGVTHFCICPGSRSTPLALTIARHPDARIWMHLDERSAAFFALGMAKASGQPVALVCTSGTAAANFLPAIVEASLARVPLVVLTADRPHELRDCGAPQTIDQIGLYGNHVKWFVDLPIPEATPNLVRYARTVAGRAVATSRIAAAGPVHLNCPYREPLVPLTDTQPTESERANQQPYVQVTTAPRLPDAASITRLAKRLSNTPRGLIICGPQNNPALAPAMTRLSAHLGYPILADPLSGLRCGKHPHTHILDSYDAFLRDTAFTKQYRPEIVLRFGAMPTSKPVLLYLQQYPTCHQIVVDDAEGWNEPTALAAEMVYADGAALCHLIADALTQEGMAHTNADWNDAWVMADRLTRTTLTTQLASIDELFEGKVFAELATLLPDGATLYAGNSMPVRDLDTFFAGNEQNVRFLSNRGANGIDGVVSSALGAQAVGADPLLLIIGDISFYHDSNGLLSARQYNLDATIILLNNDGGGIFSFLPQAQDREHFEQLFGTPHGLNFRPLAEMYGAHYQRVADWAAFRTAVQESISNGGLRIIEVVTDRERNVALHRACWPAVSAALAENGVTRSS
ncbi:MAG: 2-succinyl-5-enolpyruvyl-6-hydroxy-3-cyclohexene-1-carboxylic-acid synthase [Chloroflexota bacterium]